MASIVTVASILRTCSGASVRPAGRITRKYLLLNPDLLLAAYRFTGGPTMHGIPKLLAAAVITALGSTFLTGYSGSGGCTRRYPDRPPATSILPVTRTDSLIALV
jgi:hypothetical protein